MLCLTNVKFYFLRLQEVRPKKDFSQKEKLVP